MTTFSDLADIIGSDDDDEDDQEYVPSDEASSSEDDGEEEEVEARKRAVEEDTPVPAKKGRQEEEGEKPVCSDSLWASFLQRSVRPAKEEATSRVAPTVTKETSKPESCLQEKAGPLPSTSASDPAPKTDSPSLRPLPDSGDVISEAPAQTPESCKAPVTTPVIDKAPVVSKAAVTAPVITKGPVTAPRALNGAVRKPGGVGSLLANLKKPKLTVLEKSKQDWSSFTKEEGITEELKIHNRGKGGYLERMDFLERTDHRQFEIERDMRQGSRRNVRK